MSRYDRSHTQQPSKTAPAPHAPMFHDCTDANGVQYSSNAHPETEYEDMRRIRLSHVLLRDTSGGMHPDPNPGGLSPEVRDQVLYSTGARTGGMTFHSLLEDRETETIPATAPPPVTNTIRGGRR